MATLVCGSMTYDHIMVFRDHFKNHVLQDKAHLFSVAFSLPSIPRSFGGSAGNVVYGLKLLGISALPMATVGSDFSEYSAWLDKNNIPHPYVRVLQEALTAQIFTITDLDGNQISAVQAGAMGRSHLNSIFDAEHVTLGVIAPDGKKGMLSHAQEFKAANIPFILDPGKELASFSDIELTELIHQASYIVVNDYEWEMMHNATGIRANEMVKKIRALIITHGAKGSVIITDKKTYEIPTAKSRDKIDPIGCGDAFRAGLIYGLENHLDWETTGRVASLMGAIKLEHQGTQNYSFTLDELSHRFYKNFGSVMNHDRRKKAR